MTRRGKIREAIATSLLISLLLITTNAFVEVEAKTNSFTATIYPTEVAVNHLSTYTVTITNTGTSSLGSTGITIPTGFTVSEPIVILAPPSSWSYSLSPGGINLTATSGGASIGTNESVIFTFSAISPSSAGVTNWTARATSSIGWGGQTLDIEGPQPTVTVNSPLNAPTISASPSIIDQDQNSQLSQLMPPSGGTPPYNYQWIESFSGEPFTQITGANGATYTFSTTTSTAIGTWRFQLNVTDSSTVPETVSSNTVNVVVNSALAAPQVTATPNVVSQTQPSVLTSSSITTGTAPYTYQWFQKAPSQDYTPVGSQSSSYTFPGSTTVGTWTFLLQVTDNAGQSANSSAVDVTVTSSPSFIITVAQTAHGTINPGTTNVFPAGTQPFTISPDTGYRVADVLVDGISVGAVTSYTFVNVNADHTLTATFTQIEYTLTVNVVGSGSVTKTPDQASYHYGDVVQLTANPASGWRFSIWNGSLTGSVNPSSITINGNSEVTAIFLLNQFTITASAGAGGSINPAGATIVDYGGNQAFNISPNVGYHIVDVLVNNTSVGPVSAYTISTVTGDTTITATFGLNTMTIDTSAGPNGSINPNGTVSVVYGNDQSFSISPDIGYHVAEVLVDGVSVGAVTSYTFTQVTADHNISATFAINSYIIYAFAGPNGTINPSGTIVADWNATLSLTITPDANYFIADVKVDGVSVGPVTTYTFTRVAANHNITADFESSTGYFLINVMSSHGSPTPSTYILSGGSLNVSVTGSEGDASHRWICTGYSIDGGTPISGATYTFINVQENHTIIFNWQEQYRLTVTTTTGTTSGTGWYDAGTPATSTVSSNTTTNGSGTRQLFTGWGGDATGIDTTSNPITMDGPKTATANWKTQYYLTINSLYGNPTGQGWYDAGTTATFSVEMPTSNSTDTRIIFNWKGTDGGYTGPKPSSTATMTRPITEEATWKTQYQVTFTLTGNVLQADAPQTEWVTSGTAATGTFVPSISNSAANTRNIFVSDDRPSVITAPVTITGTYKTQYLVLFNQNGLNSNVSGTVVTILDEPKIYEQLPNSAWIDLGGSITFTYAATVENTKTGEKYNLRSTNSTSPLTINEPTTIQAEYELQTSFDLNKIALPTIIVSSLALSPVSVLAWRRRKRKITPIAGEGGSISPSTTQKIKPGGDSTVFIVTARYGYKIVDILIDNKTHLGAVRTYKFTNVNENHTITAKFSRD